MGGLSSGGSGRSSKKSYEEREFSEKLTAEEIKNLVTTKFVVYMNLEDLTKLVKKNRS